MIAKVHEEADELEKRGHFKRFCQWLRQTCGRKLWKVDLQKEETG